MGALDPVNQDIFLALVDHPRSERDLIEICYLHDYLIILTTIHSSVIPIKSILDIIESICGCDDILNNVISQLYIAMLEEIVLGNDHPV